MIKTVESVGATLAARASTLCKADEVPITSSNIESYRALRAARCSLLKFVPARFDFFERLLSRRHVHYSSDELELARFVCQWTRNYMEMFDLTIWH